MPLIPKFTWDTRKNVQGIMVEVNLFDDISRDSAETETHDGIRNASNDKIIVMSRLYATGYRLRLKKLKTKIVFFF